MNIRQIESNLYIAVACLMAATGMTKKEFTTVAGVSYCTPYFWETRTCLPSRKTVDKLAEVFSEEFPVEIRKLEDARSAVEDLRRSERESLIDRQQSSSLRSQFANKTPYCVIGTTEKVGIYDYGTTHEGFRTVLAAWMQPKDGNPMFRRTQVRKNGTGVYLVKCGSQIYFTGKEDMSKDFRAFLEGIEEG